MTIPTPPNPTAPPKSAFVTVVAWIFIVFSGFVTFISILQNLMVMLMPRGLFTQALQDTTFTRAMPAGPRFMFAHFQLMVALMLVICIATLISAIGLLRRQNWARIIFVGILGLGVAYNIAALFFQQTMMRSFGGGFPADSAFGPSAQQFQHVLSTMRATMFVFAIAFVALFCWIIVKLLSAPIRAEFVRERAA